MAREEYSGLGGFVGDGAGGGGNDFGSGACFVPRTRPSRSRPLCPRARLNAKRASLTNLFFIPPFYRPLLRGARPRPLDFYTSPPRDLFSFRPNARAYRCVRNEKIRENI